MIDLPSPRLVVEQVPEAQRPWVEKALIQPLNRFLQPLAEVVKRVMLSQLNVQVLEYRGYAPTAANPADFTSALTGPCLGLVALSARRIESNGLLGDEAGALTSPSWREVVTPGTRGSTLRVTSQQTDGGGLTAKYAFRWLALGS